MSPSATKVTPPSTDPIIYDVHHQTFAGAELPKNETEWVERAARVAAILAEDVSARDREQKIPAAEVSLLKSAALLKVLGPTKYGGGGQPWNVAYKVIREVAKGDSSLGMLLGYHLLWSWTANVVGTDEQADRWQKTIIEGNFFIGVSRSPYRWISLIWEGAVNPRDSDLNIVSDGDHIVFDGFKNFNTGVSTPTHVIPLASAL